MPSHPVEVLWHSIASVAPYPPGVIPVPEPIPGTAFFPGGYGLWRPNPTQALPTFPNGQVLILGQDFHSEGGYRASLTRGSEVPGVQTWAVLVPLLKEARINPAKCFFSNVYMGLRQGTAATGDFPGRSDPQFVNRCLDFLLTQLRMQRPRLIVTLGRPAFEALSLVSPELKDWRACGGFKGLDVIGPVREATFLADDDRLTSMVVGLLHPSLREPNIKHRTLGTLTGHKAELAMLAFGLKKAGLDAA